MKDQIEKTEYRFTEEQIQGFAGLYGAMLKIHMRLYKAGHRIEDGKLIPPPDKVEIENLEELPQCDKMNETTQAQIEQSQS